MSGSLGLRGGLFMMSRSGGLKPSAVAGRPSVTKLTHSSWTGINASGNPRAAVRKMLHGIQKHIVKYPLLKLKKTYYFLPKHITKKSLDRGWVHLSF